MNKIIFTLVLLGILCMSCLSNNKTKKKATGNKKVIVVASFGTTHEDTRKKTIEACEKKIAESYPDYEVRRVFTSNMIRKILKKRENMEVDSLQECLDKLLNEGFGHVIIQPLHIISGEEYHVKILQVAAAYKESYKSITVGRPILSTIDDYGRTVEALKLQIPVQKQGEAVIMMGHGTYHPANASYSCLQLMLESHIPSVYIGCVEGFPTLDDILPKLEAQKITRVTLMPFMVVAGTHAKDDMAGDEPESWKSILEKKGYTVEVILKGLGENEGIRNMYVENVQDCIDGNPRGYQK